MSGFQLLEKIKKNRKTKKIPVVVISAMPEDTQVNVVLDAGAQLFLEKPVALVDLLSVIEIYEKGSSSYTC